MNDRHVAASSALGYLYQTQWPLVDLVRRYHNTPDIEVHLELLDDVDWEYAGTVELTQVKQHQRLGTLGDQSVDLWRTFGTWLEQEKPANPNGPLLTLVTTVHASPDTAAYFLGANPGIRDVTKAHKKLVAAAGQSKNSDTAPARKAFLELSPQVQLAFVNRVTVADGSPPIQDLEDALRTALGFAVPRRGEEAFLGQVWAWWMHQAVAMLRKELASVSALQVRQYIDDLRSKFGDEDLPAMDDRIPDVSEVIEDYSHFVFVNQLNLVDTSVRVMQRAIQDYYRATVQSARWLENTLVNIDEVERFQQNLIDEWELCFEMALNRLPPSASEEKKKEVGRELYFQCMSFSDIHIRPRYRENFYFRGKLHELADFSQVGWHPEFATLLQEILEVRS